MTFKPWILFLQGFTMIYVKSNAKCWNKKCLDQSLGIHILEGEEES